VDVIIRQSGDRPADARVVDGVAALEATGEEIAQPFNLEPHQRGQALVVSLACLGEGEPLAVGQAEAHQIIQRNGHPARPALLAGMEQQVRCPHGCGQADRLCVRGGVSAWSEDGQRQRGERSGGATAHVIQARPGRVTDPAGMLQRGIDRCLERFTGNAVSLEDEKEPVQLRFARRLATVKVVDDRQGDTPTFVPTVAAAASASAAGRSRVGVLRRGGRVDDLLHLIDRSRQAQYRVTLRPGQQVGGEMDLREALPTDTPRRQGVTVRDDMLGAGDPGHRGDCSGMLAGEMGGQPCRTGRLGLQCRAMGTIHQHRFDNGLQLVAEPISGARSLSMTVLLPAGAAAEPADRQGVSTVLSEMICRGAGTLDARAHSDALDQLGVQRDTSTGTVHLRLSATMIGTKLLEALPLLMDMVRRPMLAESALPPSRDLALQALDSLEDEPQSKVMMQLRERHFPMPLGRSTMGVREHIEALTVQDVRAFWQSRFVPEGTIIGVAGFFDWDQLIRELESIVADWTGRADEPVPTDPAPRGYAHTHAETTQVHIGVAHDAIPETHSDAMVQRAAVAVLSGGMSGRLFTEVREKRGLCYSVGARYASHRQMGAVLSYAGTTAPRAQETLDVLVGELRRVSEGATESEFQRAIVGMKSRLVMQGESTGARAAAIASDQFLFGRPRTLDELAAEVDKVTLDRLNRFLREHAPGDMTITTIGPNALEVK